MDDASEELGVALSEADLGRIGRYVRAELPEWLEQIRPSRTDGQLMERMVRVEENLRSQRELLIEMQRSSDRRFEDVNRRFEDQNKRFDAMRWYHIATLVVLSAMMTVYQFLA